MQIKFYTSYFGKLVKIDDNKDLVPVSIAGKAPEWYNGLEYKKLAPSWSIWSEWHNSTSPDKNDIYAKRFLSERLSQLNPEVTFHNIMMLLPSNKIPVLLCYERSFDFCHRHLVRDWFNRNDIYGEELII